MARYEEWIERAKSSLGFAVGVMVSASVWS
jgi:hypothetical protein